MAKFTAYIKEAKVGVKKEKVDKESFEYPITTVTLVIDGANTDIANYVGADHYVEVGEK